MYPFRASTRYWSSHTKECLVTRFNPRALGLRADLSRSELAGKHLGSPDIGPDYCGGPEIAGSKFTARRRLSGQG